MDIYYRLLALHRAGIRVILHCFTYGRPRAPMVEACCERVYYYRRDMSWRKHLCREPFIVSSRDSDELFNRMFQDRYPLLIEGIHGCQLLSRLRQRESQGDGFHRTILVRAHNVEQDYYRRLARTERRPLRKLYLSLEASKLRRYEPVLKLADGVLAITDADAEFFRNMGCRQVTTMAPFFPVPRRNECVNDPTVKLPVEGPYVLYHGDLSVPDNEWSVRWLQSRVMRHSPYPFVVAGRGVRNALRRYLSHHANTYLVESPRARDMDALIESARCTLLVTRQATGFKLKLISTLCRGQHCLVNPAMVAGTPLDSFCHVADTASEMCRQLEVLMQTPFDDGQKERRHDAMMRLLDDDARIELLKKWLG